MGWSQPKGEGQARGSNLRLCTHFQWKITENLTQCSLNIKEVSDFPAWEFSSTKAKSGGHSSAHHVFRMWDLPRDSLPAPASQGWVPFMVVGWLSVAIQIHFQVYLDLCLGDGRKKTSAMSF